jgi:phage-related baseplate assembly protein
MEFPNDQSNRFSSQSSIRSSLEVSNETPIIGNTSLPTSEELRYRTYASRAAQMRSVTKNDYEAYIYLMPANFGSVKRASVINDPSATNRRLSVYVISEDGSSNLLTANSTLKENIKQWLNKNKMLNDSIDIYDAKIMNIGFDYEIVVHPSKDKVQVLNSVQARLNREMSEKMYIGEPFYLTNIFNIINKVDGVVDTTKVTPILKTGTGYSSAPVGIDDIKSEDGTYLKAPRNVIFEIKNFNTDVRGSAK